MVSSEEQPIDMSLSHSSDTSTTYSVAFDPLDGSSIIAADWTVGSIFAIFPGKGFLQRTGRDMVAAAYAVHGPRTLLIIARPIDACYDKNSAIPLSERCVVQEFIHIEEQTESPWVLQRESIAIAESKKIFAPANLRASKDNIAYYDLITSVWMKEQFTLRYSGGLVPDVHHILAKNGGVFCNPCSQSAPAKLRVLYEVLPLAFIVEAAAGSSIVDGIKGRSALDLCITQHEDRSAVCMGSRRDVERCIGAMMI